MREYPGDSQPSNEKFSFVVQRAISNDLYEVMPNLSQTDLDNLRASIGI